MAAGAWVAQVVATATSANTPSTSASIPYIASANAGDTVILDVSASVVGGLLSTPSSITDSQGNTFSIAAGPLLQTTSVQGFKAYCVLTSGVTSSDTISITFNNGCGKVAAVGDVFSGAGTLDATGTGSGAGGSTTATATTTGATTQAVEVSHFSGGLAGALSTNSSYTGTARSTGQGGTSSPFKSVVSESRALSSTGTITESFTYSSASAFVGLLATFAFPTAVSLTRSASESLSASDSATKSQGLPRTQGEYVSLTDSQARVVAVARSQSETASLSDSAARTTARARTGSDTASPSDTASRAVGLPRTAADSLTVSDSAILQAGKSRGGTDTFSVSDTAARLVVLTRTANESATATDVPSRTVTLLRAKTDSNTTTDTASSTSVKNLTRASVDSLTVTDSPARMTHRNLAAVETLTFSDSTAQAATYSRTAAETLTLREQIVVAPGGGTMTRGKIYGAVASTARMYAGILTGPAAMINAAPTRLPAMTGGTA